MKLTITSTFISSCVLLSATASALLDQPNGGTGSYNIEWHTIDGGGGLSFGGTYQLVGTIGQPDAGVMSGGTLTLAGGFWTGVSDTAPKCPVLADLNCDGVVNVSDMLALLNLWGPCTLQCLGDLNDDGEVDVSDLLILLENWG